MEDVFRFILACWKEIAKGKDQTDDELNVKLEVYHSLSP